MVSTDYPIEAMELLLDKACLPERFFPLTEKKELILSELHRLGCQRKSDAASLPDEALALFFPETAGLFRRFLSLYDPRPQKLREAEALSLTPEESACFRELYLLPGVKEVRARLYFLSGFRTLTDFAQSTAEEIIQKTARTVRERQLSCTVPLPKEVRTHIAVAKAFTME